ncbi:response regulator transcription factor [Pseudonocardia nematodicida]|uniref:Response regulator transcription factor n=1 Tax=Pseudonocardia nematodicida TaxID=1206997 RepID=A0ABV1K3E4_9PSEU
MSAQPLVRIGIRSLFDGVGGTRVVADCATVPDAVVEAERLRPDLVVLDVPDAAAAQLQPDQVRQVRGLGCPVIVLVGTMADRARVGAFLRAGATTILGRNTDPGRLRSTAMTAVRRCAEAGPTSPGGPASPRDPGLTPREVDVLTLVAKGESNAAMAVGLNIAASTVKWHMARAARKLGARNRTDLAMLAVRLGVV